MGKDISKIEKVANEAENEPKLVVCLGASAGGLDALKNFFAESDVQSGFAYVVVQHLSPDFKSLMGDILTRSTSMEISQLEDGTVLERDRVYLIPETKELTFDEEKRARLHDRPERTTAPLIIDHCFASLAEEFGAKSVAIVLSGTGSDGSRGVVKVRESGGLVLVQDPMEATFDGMPRSAIKSESHHFVLGVDEMPAAVRHFCIDPDEGRTPRIPELKPEHMGDLERIHKALKNMFGVDFGQSYKPPTINRRIERRTNITHQMTLKEYRKLIDKDPNELAILYKDLLIGVTSFFRDPDAFRELREKTFPELVRNVGEDTIRIWTPGCASGEEVYSIAIMLKEYLSENNLQNDVKIFATDLHRGSIEKASLAVYSDEVMEVVPPELKQKYFSTVPNGYRVHREIREMVVFALHNVLEDAPFTQLSLIVCRNLLIYFNTKAQAHTIKLFGYALRQDGFLFLGSSESLPEKDSFFKEISRKHRLFQKVKDQNFVATFRTPSKEQRGLTPIAKKQHNLSVAKTSSERLFESLIESCVPAGFLVNSSQELIYTVGDVGKFLNLPKGRMTRNLYEMVPEDLKLHFVGAIRKAMGEGREVTHGKVMLNTTEEGEAIPYLLKAFPIHENTDVSSHCFLILQELLSDEVPANDVESAKNVTLPELATRRLTELENELALAREGHQTVIEELEASNEELQSTNEELIASNEELQSTNEELQSVNEELYTVNAEYDAKNRELNILNTDLENFLESTLIGTIFLDSEYNVRRFTKSAAEVMNLRDGDEGRPIIHVTTALDLSVNELLSLIQEVEKTGKPIEREVTSGDDNVVLLRILRYSYTDGETGGFVLNFIDLSEQKRIEASESRISKELQALLRAVESFVVTLDKDGNVISPSSSWEHFTGLEWSEYKDGGWKHSIERGEELEALFKKAKLSEEDFEVNLLLNSKKYKTPRYCLARFSFSKDEDQWVVLCIDIDGQERTRRLVEQQKAMLDEITQRTSTAIYVKDLEGRYTMLNAFARTTVGLTLDDSIDGRSDWDFFPKDKAEEIYSNDRATLKQGVTKHWDETIVLPDGSERIYSSTKIPLFDDLGNPYALAGVSTDTTEFLESEEIRSQKEELERVNSELASTNKQLDSFATVASHDLKQPLRIVRNFSEILLEDHAGELGDEAQHYLSRISGAASRLSSLLEGIFEYSRSNRSDITLEQVNVKYLLDEVLEVHSDLLHENKVKVVTEDMPIVTADRTMLYQIFLNLIGNAMKFRRQDGPELRLTCRLSNAEKPIFGVEDNGIGIDKQFWNRIFEPFERLHNQDEYAGTGVGLSVTKTLIDRLGGKLAINSVLGKGTLVEFSLSENVAFEPRELNG